MANTYTLIGSASVGAGGASSIDFTSIGSTYTDLVLKTSLRLASPAGYALGRLKLAFNGSTTSFTNRLLYATGSGSAASEATVTGSISYLYADATDATASVFSSTDLYIPNYAGSLNKSTGLESVTENSAAGSIITGMSAGLWANTSAITSISITSADGFNFSQYSTAYLYGVKNA